MLKYFFTLLFIFFISLTSFCQNYDGFIAPDFTVTDINGNTHSLYEKLDEGKTVILDVYATWCAPCWTFHNQHVLEDIWNELGPNGTDEVFVMAIETDLSTTSDDLNGTGPNTMGNWVDGVPYPMVDEVEGAGGLGLVGNAYNINAFPTILFICPDRSVTSVNWQSVASSYNNVIASCPDQQGDNNCRLIEYSGVEGTVCEEVDFTPKVKFQNMGNEIVNSTTFSLTMNGTTETLEWTGELHPFQIEEMEFSNVTASNTDILIEINTVNSSPDEFPDDNTIETSILAPIVTAIDTVTIEIMTDEYGDDTYWAVLNDNDEVVAEGGNLDVGFDFNLDTDPSGTGVPPAHPGAYASNTLHTTDVYLPANGCYRFAIADFYLDGICCDYGNGYFKVVSQDNGVMAEGGNFEHREDSPFAFSMSVSTDQLFAGEINIFPNPVLDELSIEISNQVSDVESIVLFDVQGREIFNLTNENNIGRLINLDMSSVHTGFYHVKINFEDGTYARKKIVKN